MFWQKRNWIFWQRDHVLIVTFRQLLGILKSRFNASIVCVTIARNLFLHFPKLSTSCSFLNQSVQSRNFHEQSKKLMPCSHVYPDSCALFIECDFWNNANASVRLILMPWQGHYLHRAIFFPKLWSYQISYSTWSWVYTKIIVA